MKATFTPRSEKGKRGTRFGVVSSIRMGAVELIKCYGLKGSVRREVFATRIRERERRLQTLFNRFKSGALSINDFLEAIRYQTGP